MYKFMNGIYLSAIFYEWRDVALVDKLPEQTEVPVIRWVGKNGYTE